jgi:hypothetical protein
MEPQAKKAMANKIELIDKSDFNQQKSLVA